MAKGVREAEQKKRQMLFVYPSMIEKLDKIKRAEAERRGVDLTRTDVIIEALTEYIARYEKKNGPISIK